MMLRFSDQTSNKIFVDSRLETLRSGNPRGWRRRLPRAN
jgi:hypothetical protein